MIKRRTVLTAGAAAPLAGLVTHWPITAAADEGDLALILDNFVELYAGASADRSDPLVAKKVETIGSKAAQRLGQMADPASLTDSSDRLFDNLELGSAETNYTNTFLYLSEIALATVTPGTDQYEDSALQTRVLEGLDWVHRVWWSNTDDGYFGNWFHWEIGSSTNLTRVLGLLHDQVDDYDPGLVRRCVETMDDYLRNGKNGDVDLDSRFHTGANLADITMNRVIQGALLGDQYRVRKAVEDQSTVFATIDPNNLVHNNTDGYYEDGSFIQHHTVAYTGAYGRVLLQRVMVSLKTLGGSAYEADELVPTVRDWLTKGFAPVIYQGYMMEIVKGRGVSRTTSGYVDAVAVLEGAVDLAGYLEGDEADDMKAYAKYLATTPPKEPDSTSFVSPATVGAYSLLIEDDEIEASNIVPESSHFTFNAMEKDVHLRPEYSFAVARSSSRISKYEYMNGENLAPWFQGDGASYLYLDGQDQSTAFGCDYFATVGAYELGGVTSPVEARATVPEAYGELWYENPDHPLEFTSSSESQNEYVYFPLGTNEYSGGVQLGAYGLASLELSDDVAWRDLQAGKLPSDFVAYPNASGRKSYFMFDDKIVVLGSGLGDSHGRAVKTTVDARTVPQDDQVSIAGHAVEGVDDEGSDELPWLHWHHEETGAQVGYVVAEGPAAVVTSEAVRVPRKSVRLKSSGDAERHVTTLHLNHEASGRDSVVYALLPGVSQDAVRAEAADPSFKVLRNDDGVHAVECDQVTGISFFEGAKVGRYVSDQPLSVMIQKQGGSIRVAFSDPIRTQNKLRFVIKGRLSKVSGDNVEVSFSRGETQIVAWPTDGIGQTYEVELKAGN